MINPSFVSSDLSWDYHVTYLLRKVVKRMYCVNYLFRAGVPTSDIVCVYTSIIHSILEYACPVWHPGMTKKLSKDTECVPLWQENDVPPCQQIDHLLV